MTFLYTIIDKVEQLNLKIIAEQNTRVNNDIYDESVSQRILLNNQLILDLKGLLNGDIEQHLSDLTINNVASDKIYDHLSDSEKEKLGTENIKFLKKAVLTQSKNILTITQLSIKKDDYSYYGYE